MKNSNFLNCYFYQSIIQHNQLSGDKVETHYIYGKDLYFNHFSFEGHKNVSTLLIIPCLKTLLGRK